MFIAEQAGYEINLRTTFFVKETEFSRTIKFLKLIS
jgi:hypothetical protein